MAHRILAMLLALLLAPSLTQSALAAEINGQIKGTVTDSDGIEVPGALIVATSPKLIGDRNGESGPDGRFVLAQLPVGDYQVKIDKPGFNGWLVEGVRVRSGGTVNLDVQLELVVGEATIVVQEAPPIVDVEQTRMGTNLSAAQLKDLPTAGRDYQSVMAVSPGVVGSGNANMHGGMDDSNQFYVDGVNATDPVTNTFSMNMNYDAIEEVQVITGGMDAEYGRSLGGAVNIVTKSGGNEFEATGTVRFSNQDLEIYEPLSFDDPDSSVYSDQSYALNVGGPIIRDKLWFFASGQMDLYKDSVIFDNEEIGRPEGADPLTGQEMSEVAPRDWRSFYLFGKVTWQPSSAHRIWAHAQADPTSIDNAEQDIYTLPSGETWWRQGGWIGSVGHIWLPSERLNVESQLYYQNSYIDNYSVLWKDCKNWDGLVCADDVGGDIGNSYGDAWWANDPDGFSFGEYPYAYFTRRKRASANSAVNWYVDFLGQHQLKAGVQAELMHSYTSLPGIDGGLQYWNHSGDPADLTGYTPTQTYRYDTDQEASLYGLMLSAFVQDVWQPVERVTLRPGIRIDKPTLFNDVGQSVFSHTTVSPRFGLAIDLFGDQSTSLHAYYGRFTDPGFLSIADLLMQKSQGYGVYNWDEQAGDWGTEPSTQLSSTFLAHDDLRSPVSDEINIGLTRAVGEHAAFDVTYVYEHARRFWEDDEVNLIWDEEGSAVVGNRNGTDQAIYRLRTSDQLYTKYNSVEFTARANLDTWWFLGSYTWASAKGTSDAQVYTYILDIPEQDVFRSGFLGHDRTHAVKFSGTKREESAFALGPMRVGYLAGVNFRLFSGSPYQKTYFNEYYGSWINALEPNDGTIRMPAFSQTDVRGGLILGAGPTNWALTLDVINLFNSRAVTGVDTTWGNAAGDGIYTDSDGEPLFGTATNYQRPRRLSLGLRGEY